MTPSRPSRDRPSPTGNTFFAPFNDRLRAECLNIRRFLRLADATEKHLPMPGAC